MDSIWYISENNSDDENIEYRLNNDLPTSRADASPDVPRLLTRTDANLEALLLDQDLDNYHQTTKCNYF